MTDYEEAAQRWNDPVVRGDIHKLIETYGVIFLERLGDDSISGFGTGTCPLRKPFRNPHFASRVGRC